MTASTLFFRLAPFLLVFTAACSSFSGRTGDYRIALVPSRSGQHGIFVMDSDTTGGKLLTPDPSAQLRANSWSPDGQKIAFYGSREEDLDITSVYRMPHHYLLYEINVNGRNLKRLFNFPVSDFEWSPDGQKLMYISAYEDPGHSDPAVIEGIRKPFSAIYVLDLETGNQKRLTSFGHNCSGSWSPDGSKLALSFGTEKSSDIYVASPDGKSVRRLTHSDQNSIRPKWSPDGSSIAYIVVAGGGEREEPPGVYILDAAESRKTLISELAAYAVEWSPDGTSLLIASAGRLTLTEPANNRTIALAPQISRALDAAFTPDGQEVVFRSSHEGNWHLYAADLGGTKIRRITGRLTASSFCLSPLK